MSEAAGEKSNMLTPILWSAIRVAVVAYVGIALLVYFRQSKFVYIPDRHVELTPAAVGLAFEEVFLPVGDGDRIMAWYVPAAADNRGDMALVFCHGNAGDMGDRLMSIETIHKMGLDVLIFDYRGYGRSTGKPTENATYEDIRAVWDYLVDKRGMAPERIVLFGRSLGGAVACWLATQVKPAGLVLESSFTSAPDMAALMFPYLPVRIVCSFKYDNLARMEHISCPLLVAHGRSDRTIPYKHGRRLFEAAKEPKRFSEIAGGHNDGGLDIDAEYQKAFREFISSLRSET